MAFPALFLRLCAVPFAGIGVAFLLAPASMGSFVGLSLDGPTADNDVRAVYGGLQLACGALLFVLSMRPAWIHVGLIVQLALFGGLAGGRFLSWALVGLPDALGLALHGGEIVGLVVGVVVLRSGP